MSSSSENDNIKSSISRANAANNVKGNIAGANAEVLDINPITELIDKLEFKKTLTVDELSHLQTCLQGKNFG